MRFQSVPTKIHSLRCYFLGAQTCIISHINRNHSLFSYPQKHLLLIAITLQVFTHPSETAETFYHQIVSANEN